MGKFVVTQKNICALINFLHRKFPLYLIGCSLTIVLTVHVVLANQT